MLRRRHVAHTIPERRYQQDNHGTAVHIVADSRVRQDLRYRRRNVLERGLCQLEHWRNRRARNYLAGLTLAALLTQLPA
jgi:hypothetical protein